MRSARTWITPAGCGRNRRATEPWRFLGGVPADYLDANRERVRPFGDFAMWDLPDCEWRDGRIHLARLRRSDRLRGDRRHPGNAQPAKTSPGECYGLFTRGEEVGFAGAIEMARDGWLAAEGLTVISLETSAERPPARMGDGPIVRVGDKTSMFDAVRHRRTRGDGHGGRDSLSSAA